MQEIEAKWDEIKENIRKEYDLSDVSFHTWVEPLKFFDVQDDVGHGVVHADVDVVGGFAGGCLVFCYVPKQVGLLVGRQIFGCCCRSGMLVLLHTVGQVS